MSVYTIRGEVDYTSQQRKIASEYEHIGEVIREVGVSNPYDAGATHIGIYPLYTEEASCLVVVDDGVGMDNTPFTKEQLRGCNGSAESALAAYFWIGHSTKPRGRQIGQFCMGSNLALVQADALFVLVTRTANMQPGQYWVVVKTGMNTAFSDRDDRIQFHVMTLEEALTRVLDELQRVNETLASVWMDALRAAFATVTPHQGTLQLFISRGTDLHKKRILDVAQESWMAPAKRKGCKMITDPLHATQLWTYIRFMTRHGSMLAVPGKCCQLRVNHYADAYAKDTRAAELRIFTDRHPEGAVVPYGFPYIEHAPNTEEVRSIKAGARIDCFTSFCARLGPCEFSRTASTGSVPVAVYVIMDSLQVKLEQYEGLDRNGHPRSGIGMVKMQGFVITVRGVYVTNIRGDTADRLLRALPTVDDNPQSSLTFSTKTSLLAWNAKKSLNNLIILMDAQFELKTDRNGITPAEMLRLVDLPFTLCLANALQEMRVGSSIDAKRFDEMLAFMDRTCKGDAERDIQDYCKRRAYEALETGTLSIVPYPNLAPELRCVLGVGCEAHAVPGSGHEHSLVHLYGLYGAMFRCLHRLLAARPDLGTGLDLTNFRRLHSYWERTSLLFNGSGVDVQTFNWDARNDDMYLTENGMDDALHRMRQLEFKIELESVFNHPFLACDGIVVGSARPDLRIVRDSQNYEAEVIHPAHRDDPLYGGGFYLSRIKRGLHPPKSRVDRGQDHIIPVIVFRDFLAASIVPFGTVHLTEAHVDAKRHSRASKKRR